MQKLKNNLERRRYTIINFMYSFFIAISSVAVLYQFYIALSRRGENVSWVMIGATVLILILFVLCKKYLISKNLLVATYILLGILSCYSLFVFSTRGTGQASPYIVLAIIILISSIVVSVKFSWRLFLSFVLITSLITYLHHTGIVIYEPELADSSIASTVMFLSLNAILYFIVYVGFREIDFSYRKAFEYAEELEKLNQSLEEQVTQKTKKIREVYTIQSEVMHKQAILGNITQSLLHDIATPMSVVLGSINLLKDSGLAEDELKILEESILQMDSLVENSKTLIKRDSEVSEFEILEEVNKSLSILEKRISNANIKIEINISPELKMRGIQTLFNRFVSNILINAIEELEVSKKRSREIQISARKEDEKVILKIKDNGEGIPADILNNIFDPEFSSKDDEHLGFGLSFVKDIVEKRFEGNVEVRTEVGKYTEFIVRLPRNGR